MITLSGHELSLRAFSSPSSIPNIDGGQLADILLTSSREPCVPSLSLFVSFQAIFHSTVYSVCSKNVETETKSSRE